MSTCRSLFFQTLVTFEGAPYDRVYASSDDEKNYKLGFEISVSLKCGGTLQADTSLRYIRLDSFKEDRCRFLIKAVDGKDIFVFLDEDDRSRSSGAQ